MILLVLIGLNYYHLVLVVDMWGVNKVEFFVKCARDYPFRHHTDKILYALSHQPSRLELQARR